MPLVRVQGLTLSLDGYVAGPDQSEQNPLGLGTEHLHDWLTETESFRQAHGMDGGDFGVDNELASRMNRDVGAHIMGRNMFGPIRGPWHDGPETSGQPDAEWRGWWGEDPPFHHPVFVLTHHPREPLVMQGGTTFHFVSDGIESALAQAREAAGDLDVQIGGGALTVREYLAADLVDEMHLALVPLLLGGGERLFEGIDLASRFDFEPIQSSAAAAHFALRRTRR